MNVIRNLVKTMSNGKVLQVIGPVVDLDFSVRDGEAVLPGIREAVNIPVEGGE